MAMSTIDRRKAKTVVSCLVDEKRRDLSVITMFGSEL